MRIWDRQKWRCYRLVRQLYFGARELDRMGGERFMPPRINQSAPCRPRAKTATDAGSLAHAQRLLGHKTRAMTEHYTRNRKGDKVDPSK